jgi:hypothetical protein
MVRFGLSSLLIFTAFVAIGVVVVREAKHGHSWIVSSAVMLFCAILIGTLYRTERDRKRNNALSNQAREGDESNPTH